MSLAAGPFGDEIPGERILSEYEGGIEYRGGMLRLTDRRVLYRGRGFSRRLEASLALREVTGAGIARRSGPGLARLSIPVSLALLGFALAIMIESPGPLFLGIGGAIASLPFIWFGNRLVIQVGTPGYLLQVPLERRHHAAAQAFLGRLDAARFATGAPAAARTGPTARPYGATAPAPKVSTGEHAAGA